jgi:hypothetical protein
MNMITLILVIVAVLAIACVAVFLIVIAGIRGDEGHMSLADKPRTWTRAFARRVLSGYAAPTKKPARAREDAWR